jgi:hypothetical protein
VSLILDALRKLEREKDAREPSVLVVGSVPWGTRSRSRLPLVVALTATALVAVGAYVLWPRHRAARPGGPPSPVASAPAPATTPAPTPATPHASPPVTEAPAAAVAPPEPRRLSVPPVEATGEEPARARGAVRRGSPGTGALRLNAISERDGRRCALINDRLVFEGDGFDDVRILRIGEAEVEIEVGGEKRTLRF